MKTVSIIEIGMELGELMQNDFANFGFDNITGIIGQRFWFPGWESFGWRFIFVRVELSSAHLADENSVIGITGNREGLTGNLDVLRLYLDWYPVVLKLWFISTRPVLSVGLGYFNQFLKQPQTPFQQ